MGRLTQAFDYLKKDPSDMSKDYEKFHYTKLTITKDIKKLRRKLKLYRDDK
jgi:hypothetical protein